VAIKGNGGEEEIPTKVEMVIQTPSMNLYHDRTVFGGSQFDELERNLCYLCDS